MPTKTRTRLLAFFGALSLFFSTIEYLIPRPLPFFRLGLSNLPLLVSLPLFSLREQFQLLVLKIVGQGIVNGTLASYVFLFSMASSLASFTVMISLHQLTQRFSFFSRHFSLVGISLFGSLASNAVQIILSIAFIFGPSSGIIAPLFFGLGILSGVVVGLGAQRFTQYSQWWKNLCLFYAKDKP